MLDVGAGGVVDIEWLVSVVGVDGVHLMVVFFFFKQKTAYEITR